MEKVFFMTDGDISVLYHGQDVGLNFGVQYGIKQSGKWLEVGYLKNITDSGTCELSLPFKYGKDKFKMWSTKREYINQAIEYYKQAMQ